MEMFLQRSVFFMSKSFDFISLYQNEYSPEEKINENFQKIEYFANLSVVSKISSSTGTNIQSDCSYLIEPNSDEYFSDKINQIATYNNNLGWVFFQPKEGQIMYLQADGKHYKYNGNSWVILATGSQSGGGEAIEKNTLLFGTGNISHFFQHNIFVDIR